MTAFAVFSVYILTSCIIKENVNNNKIKTVNRKCKFYRVEITK